VHSSVANRLDLQKWDTPKLTYDLRGNAKVGLTVAEFARSNQLTY
jgi:hypothetical protein